MTEIHLYKSRTKTAWLIFLCLGLFAISSFVFVAGWIPTWVYGLSLALIGLGLINNLIEFYDRRPYITVNEHGLYAPDSWPEIIDWNLIKSAHIRSYPNFEMLTVELNRDIKKSPNKAELTRQAIRLNSLIGTSEVTIILTNMHIDKAIFLELINQKIKA